METMKVRVRVTKRDIMNAVHSEDGYDEQSCPIARAVKRVLVNDSDVSVGSTGKVTVDYDFITYADWTSEFVQKFDDTPSNCKHREGNPFMRPIRRTLSLPVQFLKRVKKG